MSSLNKIETISVYIDPKQVPDLQNCPSCGLNAPIVKVSRKYSFEADGVRIINTELIPEYLCNRCGMDGLLDTMVVGLPLDKAVLTKLEILGVDLPRQHALKESITRLEKYTFSHLKS